MAISKSAKIQAEIEKVTAKINEQQARLKELEQKKLEAENSEIVEIVRGMSVSLTDLPALLQTIKNGGALGQNGAVDKVSLRSALPTKKDALWRHPACFIIRFRFNAVADKRQWSSAASKPRRKTRAKLCSRFCAENEPSHQTCRSFSASRYSGLKRRSRLRCRSAAK